MYKESIENRVQHPLKGNTLTKEIIQTNEIGSDDDAFQVYMVDIMETLFDMVLLGDKPVEFHHID